MRKAICYVVLCAVIVMLNADLAFAVGIGKRPSNTMTNGNLTTGELTGQNCVMVAGHNPNQDQYEREYFAWWLVFLLGVASCATWDLIKWGWKHAKNWDYSGLIPNPPQPNSYGIPDVVR